MTAPDIAWAMPSKEVPDRDKNSAYVLRHIQAIYRGYAGCRMQGYNGSNIGPDRIINFAKDDNTGRTRDIYNNAEDLRRARKFIKGLGDALEQKKVHNLAGPNANDILTARAIKFAQPKYMLPIFDQMVTNLRDWAVDIIVTALDPDSNARVEAEKYMAKARIVTSSKPGFQQMHEQMGVGDQMKLPEGHPKDLDEWEEWAGEDLENAAAKSVELALMHIDACNDYFLRIRPLMAEELVATGVLVMASSVNAAGLPEDRVIRLEDAVLPRTMDNWDQMPYAGYFRRMTPEEILHEAGGEISEANYVRLGDKARNLAGGDGGRLNWTGRNPGTLLVFTGFFLDHLHYTAGDDNEGYRKRLGPGDDEADYTNVKATRYNVSFQGNWVVDTGMTEIKGVDGRADEAIHWGCGLSYNMPRMKNALGKTRIPMVAKAYRMEEMCVRSAAMIAEDHYDNITKIHLETAHLLNNIIPGGGVLDYDMMTGVMGKDQKQIRPSEWVKTIMDTGWIHVKGLSTYDSERPDKRVQVQLTDARIPDFSRLMNQLVMELQLFERAMGYNAASAGGTIEERDAVRNVQTMLQATDKNQAYLRNVLSRVEQEMYLLKYGQLQNVIRSGRPIKGLVKLLGTNLARSFELTEDNDPGSIGLQLEVRMTEEEHKAMMDAITDSRMAGQLTPAEVLILRGMRNLKQVQRKLEIFAERKAQRDQENQMQLVKEQTAGNQQAVQMNAQAQQQKAQMDAEARMGEMQAKWEYESKEKEAQHGRDMQKLAATIQGNLDATLAQVRESNAMMMDQIFAKLDGEERITRMKLESQERVAGEDNATKKEISHETNETAEEIAEKQAKAARSAPKAK